MYKSPGKPPLAGTHGPQLLPMSHTSRHSGSGWPRKGTRAFRFSVGLQGMALDASLICRFTALPALSSPYISLPYPSPTPHLQAGRVLFPAALQSGEAMLHIRCRHFPQVHSLPCSRRPDQCLIWVCPVFWGTGCEPHTVGDGCPISSEKEAHVPRGPRTTWQEAGKGSSFIGRSCQQFPAPGSLCHPSCPTRE